MGPMPKPADGRYRLTPTNPPPAAYDVEVSGNTITGTGWHALYDSIEDAFVNPNLWLKCLGNGEFEAVVNPQSLDPIRYNGTCVELP